MSEQQILDIRCGDTHVTGCSEPEGYVACEFVACLVSGASGVISGAKPASLFNYIPRSRRWDHTLHSGVTTHIESYDPRSLRKAEREAIRACTLGLRRFGVELVVLFRRESKMVLLAYKTDRLSAIVQDRERAAFLAEHGYDTSSTDAVIRELRRRMAAHYGDQGKATAFPHEIGLLLGYPLDDVRSFIAGEGRETCIGPWKAYGDRETEQARFRFIKECSRRCGDRFRSGETLGELLALPVTRFSTATGGVLW